MARQGRSLHKSDLTFDIATLACYTGVMRILDASKTCSACGFDLPLEAFGWANGPGSYLRGDCKACTYSKRIQYKIDNPELWKEQKRRILRKHKYNITQQDWEAIYELQQGKCAICERMLSDDVCVDHDHACCAGIRSCGKCVRGLLCSPCNKALGWFEDDASRLNNAIAYLERSER